MGVRGPSATIVLAGLIALIAAFMPWISYSVDEYFEQAVETIRAEQSDDLGADIRATMSATRTAAPDAF